MKSVWLLVTPPSPQPAAAWGVHAAKGRQRPRILDWQFRQAGSEQKEFDMNWDIIKGNWKQFRGKVKAQWGKLTDDHLDVIAGKRDELAGKIQETYGVTKDEAEQQIKRFEEVNKDDRPKGSS
jgi:uncharacterized protein YjbJ (UPF0337 family)